MFLKTFVNHFKRRVEKQKLGYSSDDITTVEPRYNGVPRSRDKQNMFAITRFRLGFVLRFFSIFFTISGAKKIVRSTEDLVIIEVC